VSPAFWYDYSLTVLRTVRNGRPACCVEDENGYVLLGAMAEDHDAAFDRLADFLDGEIARRKKKPGE
jgi:hypothetical protein